MGKKFNFDLSLRNGRGSVPAPLRRSLLAWYDASDLSTITIATGVSQWNDKSGNGYHVTEATGSNQPTSGVNTLNGKNVLKFTAASTQRLAFPAALCNEFANGESTVFIIGRQNAVAQQRLMTIATAANSTRYTIRYSSSASTALLVNNSTGTTVATAAEFISSDFNIICGRHSGTTQAISVNGSSETSNTSAANVGSTTKGYIGASGDGTTDPLDGHIAEIIIYNRSLTSAERNIIFRYLYNKWGVIIAGTLDLSAIKPSDLTIPYTITYDGYKFSTNLDVSTYKTTPTTTYYITTSGNNSNDGLSAGAPKASVNGVITAGNITASSYQCNAATGTYDRNVPWDATPNYNFNLVGTGTPILSSQQALTLAVDGTYTNTYTAARSAVGWVYDTTSTDSNGTYLRYDSAATLADCDSTAGSWYTDGVSVWIHAFDGRNLTGSTSTTGIIVELKVNGPTVTTNINVYLENINVYGFQTQGINIANNSGITNFYWNGGSAKYSLLGSASSGNLLSIKGATSIIKGVTFADAYEDGFNYHSYNSIIPVAHEVNCNSYDCGYSGGGASNASTMHDGGRMVRIGDFTSGNYTGAQSRNIHDIGSGTWSFNAGIKAASSRGGSSSTSVNYMCGDGATTGTTQYLLKCKSSGSTVDIRTETGCFTYVDVASGLLYGSNTQNGTGSLLTFVPRII